MTIMAIIGTTAIGTVSTITVMDTTAGVGG
jgi:hypothetical protein